MFYPWFIIIIFFWHVGKSWSKPHAANTPGSWDHATLDVLHQQNALTLLPSTPLVSTGFVSPSTTNQGPNNDHEDGDQHSQVGKKTCRTCVNLSNDRYFLATLTLPVVSARHSASAFWSDSDHNYRIWTLRQAEAAMIHSAPGRHTMVLSWFIYLYPAYATTWPCKAIWKWCLDLMHWVLCWAFW